MKRHLSKSAAAIAAAVALGATAVPATALPVDICASRSGPAKTAHQRATAKLHHRQNWQLIQYMKYGS